MELSEANRLIEVLEQRYFEMHHRASQDEGKLVTGEGSEDAGLRERLEEVEREKLAILARIAQIEDGLLEDE